MFMTHRTVITNSTLPSVFLPCWPVVALWRPCCTVPKCFHMTEAFSHMLWDGMAFMGLMTTRLPTNARLTKRRPFCNRDLLQLVFKPGALKEVDKTSLYLPLCFWRDLLCSTHRAAGLPRVLPLTRRDRPPRGGHCKDMTRICLPNDNKMRA